MKTVGSRELKNRLGRYLGQVRRGETIIVTDRGKTVAHLIPPSPEPEDTTSLEAILEQLEIEGHLRRGSGQFKSFKPISKKGKPASRILLEERD
jgi:prevent-host-death family protein